MKLKFLLLSVYIFHILTACQAATPVPSITTAMDSQFTLAPGQSAMITDTDLMITFDSVLSDDRCPSDVECVASGAVSISLSVQQANEPPSNVTLETFTDEKGRSPSGPFEGITDRTKVGDYLIQIVAVTPYPKDPSIKIQPSDYQATFVVSQN